MTTAIGEAETVEHYTVRLPDGSDLEAVADALRVIDGVEAAVPVHDEDGTRPAIEVTTSQPHLFEMYASETVLEAFGIYAGPDTEDNDA